MSEQHFTQEQAQAMYAALQYVANEPPRFGHNIPLRIQLVARDTLQAIDSAADDIELEFDVDSFTPHEAKTLADKIDGMLPLIEAAEAQGRYRVKPLQIAGMGVSWCVVISHENFNEIRHVFDTEAQAQAQADRLNGGGA